MHSAIPRGGLVGQLSQGPASVSDRPGPSASPWRRHSAPPCLAQRCRPHTQSWPRERATSKPGNVAAGGSPSAALWERRLDRLGDMLGGRATHRTGNNEAGRYLMHTTANQRSVVHSTFSIGRPTRRLPRVVPRREPGDQAPGAEGESWKSTSSPWTFVSVAKSRASLWGRAQWATTITSTSCPTGASCC
jgi:hypothetical protein